MINLDRPEAPVELDEATAAALSLKYQTDETSVWNATYIRTALLDSSRSKCAYCETKIDEESKYMEVEHFRCKADFPHMVVAWDNLLPSCKRCNGNKSAHNVEVDGMIVNPFERSPRAHLYLHNSRLRSRDEIGRNTVEALYLNEFDRLVAVRAAICDAVAASLEQIAELIEEYQAGNDGTRRRNRIVRGMEKLLREASPSAEYSATAATALLGDPDYTVVRAALQDLALWAPLQPLEDEARACALL